MQLTRTDGTFVHTYTRSMYLHLLTSIDRPDDQNGGIQGRGGEETRETPSSLVPGWFIWAVRHERTDRMDGWMDGWIDSIVAWHGMAWRAPIFISAQASYLPPTQVRAYPIVTILGPRRQSASVGLATYMALAFRHLLPSLGVRGVRTKSLPPPFFIHPSSSGRYGYGMRASQ